MVALGLSLAACDELTPSVGTVILFHRGEAKLSAVRKIGSYCWVAWYERIEKIILRGDGTAIDPPFKYRWELNRAGPANVPEDRQWFSKNCAEPAND